MGGGGSDPAAYGSCDPPLNELLAHLQLSVQYLAQGLPGSALKVLTEHLPHFVCTGSAEDPLPLSQFYRPAPL